MKRFEGLIAAAHTPFCADGKLNLEKVDKQARLFVETGITAVFVGGTTGECHSLTVAERQELAHRWVEVADNQFDVIIHVGHNCQSDAVALAAHAKKLGVAAISAMAPCYHLPQTVEDLVEFFRPIAAAAGPLPFYYYDIPDLTGVRFPADRFLKHGSRRLPTLAGIKFTSGDFMAMQRCLQLKDGCFDILFGKDELLLNGLAMGTRGAVGSTYNYAAPVYQRISRAFAAGDLPTARSCQLDSVHLIDVLVEFGVLRAGKAIMSFIGVDCGPVRPPLRPLEPEELRALYGRIHDLAIFSRPLCRPEGWENEV